MEESKSNEYSISCHDIAHIVEFSPFDWSCHLLAVGTTSRIIIYSCRFQEEDPEVEGFCFTQLRDFQNGCRVTSLAWSPDTSLVVVPKVLRFAASGSDHKLCVFSSDMKDDDSVRVLEGHTDFINSVTFDPNNGDQLASTGDDLTCRLWKRDGEQEFSFPLGAPGMSVCWHHEEPMKILVAQKDGIIKIFSLNGQQQIMSLDCGQTPLMAADWSHVNCLLVGAATGTDWMIFDTSMSSRPLEKRQAHSEGTRLFKWARCQETLLSTLGRPGRQVKVFNTRHNQIPLTSTQQVAYGLSWHLRLPILAVGGDHKVHIHMIEPS